MSQDCRVTVVHVRVANPSPKNIGEFTIMLKFRDTRSNVVRQSRDSLEKTCEQLANIWRENKTKRQSYMYECRETLSRMSRDCRANENKTEATFVETS